jgi:heterodisulfide reductase subunit B
MCYNTISRAQKLILGDKEKREKVNDFMYKEKISITGGEVSLVHFLTLLRERIGFETIRAKISPIETEIKGAAYYGCMLVRPKEISIDSSPDDPAIMEETLALFGVEPVYFPFKTECCGSYQVVNKQEVIYTRTKDITGSARNNGADLIVTSCPLCCYNLDYYQTKIAEEDPAVTPLPVFYIAELLALMAGLEVTNDYGLHYVDPIPLLTEKGIIRGVKA